MRHLYFNVSNTITRITIRCTLLAVKVFLVSTPGEIRTALTKHALIFKLNGFYK